MCMCLMSWCGGTGWSLLKPLPVRQLSVKLTFTMQKLRWAYSGHWLHWVWSLMSSSLFEFSSLHSYQLWVRAEVFVLTPWNTSQTSSCYISWKYSMLKDHWFHLFELNLLFRRYREQFSPPVWSTGGFIRCERDSGSKCDHHNNPLNSSRDARCWFICVKYHYSPTSGFYLV